jgi:hypothetical protein
LPIADLLVFSSVMIGMEFFSVETLRPLCLCGEGLAGQLTTETQRTQRLHREEANQLEKLAIGNRKSAMMLYFARPLFTP